MASTLELTLVFLLAAVAGVVVCRLARVPPMLGYLAVGIVLGPSAIGVASEAGGVGHLADFGIATDRQRMRADDDTDGEVAEHRRQPCQPAEDDASHRGQQVEQSQFER